MEDTKFWAAWYEENHPDKERDFLGIFSSEEKAQAACDSHMKSEKKRLPHANIGENDYIIRGCMLDQVY